MADLPPTRPRSPLSINGHVRIPMGAVDVDGRLHVPLCARGLVIFAHGTGSNHLSARNQHVACALHAAGFGSLLFDLLSRAESAGDLPSRGLRFDIDLLTSRLLRATDWLRRRPESARLGFGYFGGSTGAAAALRAAVERPNDIQAVVCRGGRTDLVGRTIADVTAPTLLIVGGWDDAVLQANRETLKHLGCPKHLQIVAGATHLFEEQGAIEQVAELAADWFRQHLRELPREDCV